MTCLTTMFNDFIIVKIRQIAKKRTEHVANKRRRFSKIRDHNKLIKKHLKFEQFKF